MFFCPNIDRLVKEKEESEQDAVRDNRYIDFLLRH